MPLNTALHAARRQSLDMLPAIPRSAPKLRQGYLLSSMALHDLATNTHHYTVEDEQGNTHLQTGTLLTVLSVTATSLGIEHRLAFGPNERPAIVINGGGPAVFVTPWDAVLQGLTPLEGLQVGAEPVVDPGADFAEVLKGADSSREGVGARIDVLNIDTHQVRVWRVFRADHTVQSTLTDEEIQFVASRIAGMYRSAQSLLRD